MQGGGGGGVGGDGDGAAARTPQEPLRKRRVVVMGAGVAGLTAAGALQLQGCDVTVLEVVGDPCKASVCVCPATSGQWRELHVLCLVVPPFTPPSAVPATLPLARNHARSIVDLLNSRIVDTAPPPPDSLLRCFSGIGWVVGATRQMRSGTPWTSAPRGSTAR